MSYSSYDKFKKAVFDHLTNYKLETLQIKECGTYDGMQYGHILPRAEFESNFLKSDNINAVSKYHSLSHHLNSSQVMCINFFYPITKDPELQKYLLEIIVNNTAFKLSTDSNFVRMDFEFIPHDGEKTTVDFYAELSTGERLFLECKYTEQGFTNVESEYRNGKRKPNWENVYKPIIIKSRYIKDMEPGMFYHDFQLWRNIACIESEKDFVCFVYPKDNRIIDNAVKKTIVLGDNPVHFKYENASTLDWAELTEDILRRTQGTKYYDYYLRFKDKYLNY